MSVCGYVEGDGAFCSRDARASSGWPELDEASGLEDELRSFNPAGISLEVAVRSASFAASSTSDG